MKDDAAPGRHDAAATTRGEGVAALLAESGFASASELRAALAELAQRREHVDPLTGLPDRLRCLQWFSVDDHAWGGDAPRALLLLDA